MFIKPNDLFQSIDEFKDNYEQLYEMYGYLDKSRDGYIEENLKLKEEKENILIFFSVVYVIWFVLGFLYVLFN